MKVLGIIPARYGSTRFPGKPLVDIRGKTMIQRVYEQCLKAGRLNMVVVATDDERIFNHLKSFGGEVMMTSESHNNGTERCGEVVSKLNGYDVAINIQGDEPFISPAQIDTLAACFDDGFKGIATLAKRIEGRNDIDNPNIIKVIIDKTRKALYFSRAAIPFKRDAERQGMYFKHIGIYAYHVDVLKEIVKLPPAFLETNEMLEQLRWLENGYSIRVEETDEESFSVDTPEDLLRF